MKENALVLFQGDSTSDCGRSREDDHYLGTGYPYMAAAWYGALHPGKNVRFVNRAISGNRSIDLVNRWQRDCLDVKPDVVSILIGINDTWRRFDRKDPTSAEVFRDHYRRILSQVREHLDADIILMEPFLLMVTEEQKTSWREDLNPKIDVVRELAREFDAALVPLDGIFAAASSRKDPRFWAADGVHPTAEGHAMICRHWLKAAESL
ncbi:SGNH/GDSL hydrolase family protein [Eubacteriales bacterium mix99]